MVISGSKLSLYGLCYKIWLRPHAGGPSVCNFFISYCVIQERIICMPLDYTQEVLNVNMLCDCYHGNILLFVTIVIFA